jgi:membrane complex biogenesis BtpA family protein
VTKGDFQALFGSGHALIGMVHLLPLPGAPRYGGDFPAVLDRAAEEARTLAAAGFNGVLVENFHDVPFYPDHVPPQTVAAMATAAAEVRRVVHIPVGVNVLRNDGLAALAVATAAGAAFIRVNVLVGAMITDQGLIQGRAHDLMRLRASLGTGVLVFADLLVKHARPLVMTDPTQAAEETVGRGLADALIVTGTGTGKPADQDVVRTVRAAVPSVPLLVGSGITADTVRASLDLADGVIVGSSLKEGGRAEAPLDPARAAAFVQAARVR